MGYVAGLSLVLILPLPVTFADPEPTFEQVFAPPWYDPGAQQTGGDGISLGTSSSIVRVITDTFIGCFNWNDGGHLFSGCGALNTERSVLYNWLGLYYCPPSGGIHFDCESYGSPTDGLLYLDVNFVEQGGPCELSCFAAFWWLDFDDGGIISSIPPPSVSRLSANHVYAYPGDPNFGVWGTYGGFIKT